MRSIKTLQKMTKFVGFSAKTYSYLIGHGSKVK